MMRLGRGHRGLELAGSGVEVGNHQLYGPVGVAGQRGLADLAMLVGSVATDGTGRQRRPRVPVELRRAEQPADPLDVQGPGKGIR